MNLCKPYFAEKYSRIIELAMIPNCVDHAKNFTKALEEIRNTMKEANATVAKDFPSSDKLIR